MVLDLLASVVSFKLDMRAVLGKIVIHAAPGRRAVLDLGILESTDFRLELLAFAHLHGPEAGRSHTFSALRAVFPESA